MTDPKPSTPATTIFGPHGGYPGNTAEPTRSGKKTAGGFVQGACTSERNEDYANVVARLNDRWRVIGCKYDLQWILQRSKAEGGPAPVWRGEGYFRTREALVKACAALCGPVDPKSMAILEALPDNYRSAT